MKEQFQLEVEMASPVREWLNAKSLLVRQEFVTSFGVCDFVGVRIAKGRAKHRIRLGQKSPLTNPSRVALLKSIPDAKDGRSITLRKLNRIFRGWLSDERLMSDLDTLINDGYVMSPRLDHFQSLNGWVPLHRNVVAVELKLSRIAEALFQASNNLSFATESYVALPIDRAHRVRDGHRLREFENVGVGILGVSKKECVVIVPSRADDDAADPVLQMSLVERFWSEWVTNN